MKKQCQLFFLVVLVVASLPALHGYRRTLRAIPHAPSLHTNAAPAPSPFPFPFPFPPTPTPAPAPSPFPFPFPPTPTPAPAPSPFPFPFPFPPAPTPSPFPFPFPFPFPPTPTPAPTPLSPFPLPPPIPTGGGNVLPQDSGGGPSGLSGGQKAGIVIGVLAGAGLIGFATMVYMKRRSNIRKSHFIELARSSQF